MLVSTGMYWHSNSPPTAMALISRQKLMGGPGLHYGVAQVDLFGQVHEVVHLTHNSKVVSESLHDFLAGLPIRGWVAVTDPSAVLVAHARLQTAIRNSSRWRYDLAGRNCEHFARWIVFGHDRSDQVAQCAFFGLTGLLIYAFGQTG